MNSAGYSKVAVHKNECAIKVGICSQFVHRFFGPLLVQIAIDKRIAIEENDLVKFKLVKWRVFIQVEPVLHFGQSDKLWCYSSIFLHIKAPVSFKSRNIFGIDNMPAFIYVFIKRSTVAVMI